MDTAEPIPAGLTREARRRMIGGVLSFQDLQQLCTPRGPLPRVGTVRRWAERQGIRYKADGRGGIWTTVDALNSALGVVPDVGDETPIEDLI